MFQKRTSLQSRDRFTTFTSNGADVRVFAGRGENTVSFKSFYDLFQGWRNA